MLPVARRNGGYEQMIICHWHYIFGFSHLSMTRTTLLLPDRHPSMTSYLILTLLFKVTMVGTVVVGEVVVHNTLSLFFTSCSFLYCFIMVSISSGSLVIRSSVSLLCSKRQKHWFSLNLQLLAGSHFFVRYFFGQLFLGREFSLFFLAKQSQWN